MLHLVWYILIGLIAGLIAKSVMHAHLSIFGRLCWESSAPSLEAPLLICFCLHATSVFIPPVLFSPLWVRSWCCLFATNSRFDFRTCRIARE